MKKILREIGITVVAVLAFCAAAFAQQETASVAPAGKDTASAAAEGASGEDAFTVETVSGEVSGIAKNSISIIYNHDYDTGTDYEVLIPLDSATALKHKRDFSEIKAGDLVSVEYEKPAEGSKRRAVARTVIFIQSGVKGLVTQTADSAYSGTAQP